MDVAASVEYPDPPARAAILEYSKILAAYPSFIMPTARLPLAKRAMKAAIRAAWLRATDERSREAFVAQYVCLGLFRDDVVEPIGPWLKNAGAATAALAELYDRLSVPVAAEISELRVEFDTFRARRR